MAIKKQFQTIKDLVVFPSVESTIEVVPTDGYDGVHRYRAMMCTGFNKEKNTSEYISKTATIQFVQKNEDGSTIPGWQSEQLALILLDRVVKLNAKYPSEYNKKQIEGLTMYLDACKARIEDRMEKGIMEELKK